MSWSHKLNFDAHLMFRYASASHGRAIYQPMMLRGHDDPHVTRQRSTLSLCDGREACEVCGGMVYTHPQWSNNTNSAPRKYFISDVHSADSAPCRKLDLLAHCRYTTSIVEPSANPCSTLCAVFSLYLVRAHGCTRIVRRLFDIRADRDCWVARPRWTVSEPVISPSSASEPESWKPTAITSQNNKR